MKANVPSKKKARAKTWAEKEYERYTTVMTEKTQDRICKEGYQIGSREYKELIDNLYFAKDCAAKALRCVSIHGDKADRLTRTIENRLLDGFPLTDIEESDFEENGECPRYPSIKKTENGYSDSCRVICRDITNGHKFANRYVTAVIDELYPISLPYSAIDNFRSVVVNTEDCPLFETDSATGKTERSDNSGIVHAISYEWGNEVGAVDRYWQIIETEAGYEATPVGESVWADAKKALEEFEAKEKEEHDGE